LDRELLILKKMKKNFSEFQKARFERGEIECSKERE
jgi:hypothetical protein